MEHIYGRGRPSMEGSVSDPAAAAASEWSSPAPEWSSPAPEMGLEESMWQQLSLGGRDSYPERPGELDCNYYMRTGFCGYGSRCRFNHPRDRSSVGGVSRGGGEFPERIGQPVCQFFMKTGTCKFGATCKYHHPRYGGGSASAVSLNYDGYPLRPGERECSYYVKTGQCKFGATCKFHHPQPTGISVPGPAPAFYPTVQSPSAASPTQYGNVATWQVARPPLMSGSYVQGPYGAMMFSPGMVPIPGWNTYPSPVSPVASPGAQHTVGAGSLYGLTPQLSPTASAYPVPYTPISAAAGPSSSSQKVSQFPERPGQPECQFYLRTGDCKYGSTCRYHHPPQWSQPKTTCALSPIGLPLRPGAPPCSFYAQHGTCKCGPTCKFDHPMGISYSPSASSLVDMPVAPYPVGISMAKLAPSSSSSELRPEFIAGSNKDSFSTRMPSSSDNTSSVTVGSIFSKGGGSASQPHVQLSGQSSASPSSSSAMGHGNESRSSS